MDKSSLINALKAKGFSDKIIEALNKTELALLTTDNLFKSLDSQNKVKFFQNESLLLEYIKEVTDSKSLIVIEGRFEPKTLKVLFAHSIN